MKTPYLIPIEPSQGLDEALIFIGGYLSKDNDSPEDNGHWWWNIRRSGWKGSIYYLWWDASHQEAALQNAIVPAVGSIHHWEKCERRAKKVGELFLLPIIEDLPERKITLVGFSLGARIIYYALRELKEWPISSRKVDHVILIAGAIRRGTDKNWASIAPQLNGRLINIYNENDSVLQTLFRVVALSRSACGVKPIKEYHPKIINVNATSLLNTSSHKAIKYAAILPKVLVQYL